MSSSARSDGAESGVPPLIVVVGPTASGKSELALRLAEAAQGEIVSADSVQVYRGFDIGSSKPTEQEQRRAVHHLIDVATPGEPLDAAQWATLAASAIDAIGQRGRRALVCGGTFLWVRALLHGLADAPPANPEIRAGHRQIAEREGRPMLHAKLAKVDPALAAKLNPNDLVRVSRALEVWELTGVSLSAWQAHHGFRRQRYDARLVGILWPRAEIDARIRARVDRMLASGWIDEVRSLSAAGLADSRPMRSVGYRQLAAAIEDGGEIDSSALTDAVVRATRVFARRQRTWLRDQPVLWLSPQTAFGADAAELVARIDARRT
jgi:tRNA dimethylallyltransferase